jgi:hypothetical protein
VKVDLDQPSAPMSSEAATITVTSDEYTCRQWVAAGKTFRVVMSVLVDRGVRSVEQRQFALNTSMLTHGSFLT